MGGAIVTLAAYGGVMALMWYTYRETRLRSDEGAGNAAPEATTGTAELQGAEQDEGGNRITDSIAERCDILSTRYHLTRRESEVLYLLAQGRTRTFIQEELVLSVSTVKTHISHIYTKLGVHDRQGIMDLVLESDSGTSKSTL
jgi:DNA-binding NarL/FixJ family response regulator